MIVVFNFLIIWGILHLAIILPLVEIIRAKQQLVPLIASDSSSNTSSTCILHYIVFLVVILVYCKSLKDLSLPILIIVDLLILFEI